MPRRKAFDEQVQVDLFGCHRWMGCLDRDGYGRFGGKLAHRVAFERTQGAVPHGLQVDHLCTVRDCVNPEHLDAKTARENTLRSLYSPSAINARKKFCDYGHPFDETNTYVTHQGWRQCRACDCRRHAEQRQRSVLLIPVESTEDEQRRRLVTEGRTLRGMVEAAA